MKVKKQKDEVIVSFSDVGIAYVISKDGLISARKIEINSEDQENIGDFELVSLQWNDNENLFDIHNHSKVCLS
jgi:hypothetical protein